MPYDGVRMRFSASWRRQLCPAWATEARRGWIRLKRSTLVGSGQVCRRKSGQAKATHMHRLSYGVTSAPRTSRQRDRSKPMRSQTSSALSPASAHTRWLDSSSSVALSLALPSEALVVFRELLLLLLLLAAAVVVVVSI